MKNDLKTRIQLGNVEEAARMIIVTVTEHSGVERSQVDIQRDGVVHQSGSLAAVEDHPAIAPLDQD